MRLLYLAIQHVVSTSVIVFLALLLGLDWAFQWALVAGLGVAASTSGVWAIVYQTRKRAGVDPPL